MVCKASGKKRNDFTMTKNDMVEQTCKHLHDLELHKIQVQHVQLDPARENLKLSKCAESSEWAMLQPIDFEIMSQNTPQHNSLTELAFPYLAGKAHAMMRGAMMPDDLWCNILHVTARWASHG